MLQGTRFKTIHTLQDKRFKTRASRLTLQYPHCKTHASRRKLPDAHFKTRPARRLHRPLSARPKPAARHCRRACRDRLEVTQSTCLACRGVVAMCFAEWRSAQCVGCGHRSTASPVARSHSSTASLVHTAARRRLSIVRAFLLQLGCRDRVRLPRPRPPRSVVVVTSAAAAETAAASGCRSWLRRWAAVSDCRHSEQQNHNCTCDFMAVAEA